VNLGALVAKAIKTATTAGLGGPLLLARPSVADPLTGTQPARLPAYSVSAVVDTSQLFQRAPNSEWASASIGLQIAATDCAWPPLIGDAAQWGGRTFPVVALTAIAPTGTAIAYLLGLGG